MQKPAFFAAFCLVFAALVFQNCTPRPIAQTPGFYERSYQNRLDAGSQMIAADAIWTLEKTRDGRFVFKEYFFDTGQKTAQREYRDQARKVQHGPQKIWNDEGQLLSDGQFLDGKASGLWMNFHPKTSRVSTQGMKKNGESVGPWLSFRSDGTLESTYFFGDSSRLEGEKVMFDEAGKTPERRQFFEKGKLVRADPLDEKGDDPAAGPVEKMPEFPGGEKALYPFLAKSVRYPADARAAGVQGRVIANFLVEKDGSVSGVEIPRGLSVSIKKECFRVIESMPRWSPGEQNGRPVRVRFSLPLTFKLE